jgi:hypothetical protein
MPQYNEYISLKARSWSWLDQLEVDPVLLRDSGLKGKKKLAEILQAYMSLAHYTHDPGAQARIQQRVLQLARQTERPEYHDMEVTSDADFLQNSLSYLRVLELLQYFSYDTTSYLQHLQAMKARLDAHMSKRGPWQQAMFALYYTRFGLEKPPGLTLTMTGLMQQRFPPLQYDREKAYQLTHEVFVVFDYGLQRAQHLLTAEDREYLRVVLPMLVRTSLRYHDADLLAEVLLCMLYVGWQTTPIYCQGLYYLLEHQNPNGTWGNYEILRQAGQPYVDQHVYLHTTMVVLQSLIEAYEGHWPVSR